MAKGLVITKLQQELEKQLKKVKLLKELLLYVRFILPVQYSMKKWFMIETGMETNSYKLI